MKITKCSKLEKFALTWIALSLSAWSASASPLQVGIASGSAVKKDAVKKVFQEIFANRSIVFNSFAAQSQVAEQPVSEASGILGATRRLEHAQSNLSPDQDYWISIENYIEEPSDRAEFWSDRAVVILQRKNETPVMAFSERVYFASEYAEEARSATPQDYEQINTGFSVTSGKVIQASFAKQGKVIAHDNWHIDPQFGGVSRITLIENTIYKAIAQVVSQKIQVVQGFKGPGITFRDMDPLLADPELYSAAIQLLAHHFQDQEIDGVAGLETRGYLLAAPLAIKLNKPFYRVAKKGKLAKPTYRSNPYSTEYDRQDGIEIDADHLTDPKTGKKKVILLVDDLLATGGSLQTAEDLFIRAGGIPVSTCLIEISALNGVKKLTSPASFYSLVQY